MEYTIGTKVFKDWEIAGELGEGSYGKVFEVKKEAYGVTTRAALKMIRIPKSVSDIKEAYSEGMDEKSVTSHFEGIVNRLMKEIAIMSELKSHPNIVSCEDYVVEPHDGKIGWDILIRMELLTSLADYQMKHKMDEATVRRLAEDICEALVFCQKKGLIHRDIKPANLFADELGRFKLGDFGVARVAEKTIGGYSKQGTENYMAPEVYLGRSYGATVDIYSLGLVLYRLMNGNRLPFYPAAPSPIDFSDRENALVARMRGDLIPPPCNASEEFSAIILKACAYDSKDRYRTAAEMLAALRNQREVDLKKTDVPEEPARVYVVGEDGTWSEKYMDPASSGTTNPACDEEEPSIGSIGFHFGKRNDKKDEEPLMEPEKVIEPVTDEQDDGSIGTIGFSWGKKNDAEEKKEEIEEHVEVRQEEEQGGVQDAAHENPESENSEGAELSMSKVALTPLLFVISWTLLPSIMYLTGTRYIFENKIVGMVVFLSSAVAIAVLMYMSVTLTKMEVVYTYVASFLVAAVYTAISAAMGTDWGMLALMDGIVMIVTAIFTSLIRRFLHEKNARIVAGGVVAVLVYALSWIVLING